METKDGKLIGPLFTLGMLAATPAALGALQETGVTPSTVLQRHAIGDWGDVCAEDAALNDTAVQDADSRIFSVYNLAADVALYVITEADRTVTTLLLREEY